ncbi:heparinase II/III domain-containing protein [Niallia sp. FSL M8-0099]|uniref:heparinase II/III domain-containing protein n=1 Tax=Niallia sp. FSL M8-0099 TaxID=2954519 RepID=UPI0030F9D0CE
MKIKKKFSYFVLILIMFFSSVTIHRDSLQQNNVEYKGKNNISSLKEPVAQVIINDLKRVSPNKKHPRLLATSEDFEKIKESLKTDSNLKRWYKELTINANNLLEKPIVTYEKSDGVRLLPISRTVLDRTLTLSLMYRLSGNKLYAERAWKELELVSDRKRFYDWNPSHFLDTAEMAAAVGIGFDWLYDYLNQNQKEILKNSIINNALIPALKVYNNDNNAGIPVFWKYENNNWNTVCNSGILISALAIVDETINTQKISIEVIQNALSSVKNSLLAYGDDGGTEEGPVYWSYATKYAAILLSTLEKSLGTDYNFTKIKGLSETGYYPIYTTGNGGLFNIGDSNDNNLGNLSQLFWFSNKYNKPELSYRALKTYSPLNMIWYRPKEEKNYPLPLDKMFNGSAGIVTMRSSWDSKSSFVGIHAGDNQASHGDLDIGTFVIDALGERWAIDLGMDNYNLPGYFDKKSKRWNYYRKRAEGQNTLVINPDEGPDQNIFAKGKIIDFTSKKNEASTLIDMTDAYKNAKSIQRRASLINDRNDILIEDNIKLSTPSEIYWFMHTRANIGLSVDRKTAILVMGEKFITVTIKNPSNAKFSVMDAKPLSSSLGENQKQNQNNNIKKLAIHLENVKETQISIEFETQFTK